MKRLSGMFTITIWDQKNQVLYMVRDSFGIKPVYYHLSKDGQLIFASEIKGILEHPEYRRRINTKAIKPYLMTQCSSMEETFFKDIYILKPGHLLSFSEEVLSIAPFNQLDFRPPLNHQTISEDYIHSVICDAVKSHGNADVKVGAFLSGGVDSSYLTALLRPDKTFSVGFEHDNPMFNETNEAKLLSEKLGIEHYQKIIHPDEFFHALGNVQYHMDEPHANLSAVPLYFLSQLAKEHVTVVLSGEGSDELFAGYDSYRKSKYEKICEILPQGMRKTLASISHYIPNQRIRRLINKSDLAIEKRFIGQAEIFAYDELQDVLKSHYLFSKSAHDLVRESFFKVNGLSELTKMQYVDLNHWLPNDILQKADKMSMAHSLELRVPFLSKNVFHCAKCLKDDDRINQGITKYLLRKASQEVLPDDWAFRPKVGFPVPFSDWIREEKYYELVKLAFSKPVVNKYFNQDYVMTMLDNHYHAKANNGRKIYTIYCFILWYQEYFEKYEEISLCNGL